MPAQTHSIFESVEGIQLTNELNSQAETYLNEVAKVEDLLEAAANQSRKLSPSLLPLFIFCTWILRLSSHETDRQWHLNILKALIGNGGQEGIPGMSLVLKTDQEAKELLNWVQVKLGKKEKAPTDQEISEIVTGGISNVKHLLTFYDSLAPNTSKSSAAAAAPDSSGDNVDPAAESGGKKAGRQNKERNLTAHRSSSSLPAAEGAQAKPAEARKASPLIVGRGAALEPTVDDTASLSEVRTKGTPGAKDSLKSVIEPKPNDLLVKKGADVEELQTMLVDFLSTIKINIKQVKSEAQIELQYDAEWEEANGMISELGKYLRLPAWMTGAKAREERAKQRKANAREVRKWLKHVVDENRLPDSCKESYRKLLETPITEIWKRRLNICFPKERAGDTSSHSASFRTCQKDVFLQIAADARHCFLMTECVSALFRLQLTAELEMNRNEVDFIAHAIAANSGRDLKGKALEKAVEKAKASDWSELPEKQQFYKKAVSKAEEAIALFPPPVTNSSVKDIGEKVDEHEKKLESLEKFFSGKECKWRGRR